MSSRKHASRRSAPVPASPRRGGAQPGNANALKHGLYSRHHPPFDRKALQQVPVADLQGEIDLTRLFLQRYLASLDHASPDPETWRRALLTVNFTVAQLASMVRLQARARLHLFDSQQLSSWLADLPESKPD